MARRVSILPTTTLGRRALQLAVAAIVFQLAWIVLPGGGVLGFACGIAAGVTALVAVRRHDRAVSVFAAILPLPFVVLFILAELLIGHD